MEETKIEPELDQDCKKEKKSKDIWPLYRIFRVAGYRGSYLEAT